MKQLIPLIIVLLLVAACSKESGNNTNRQKDILAEQEDSDAWRIAVLPTMDCVPLIIAKERGFFSSQGIHVRLCPFQAQLDIDTAIVGGSVDGAATDLVRAAHLESSGVELSRVSSLESAWYLVALRSARIRKLVQLDDKMLAMTRYSVTDMLSDRVVDSAKLVSERVFRIQVNDVGVRLGMLTSGIMDAMFLPEPQATQAQLMKHPVLLSTNQLDLRMGVLVFRNQSLRHKDKDLKTFLSAYDMAVDSMNVRGLQAYSDIIHQYLGISHTVIDTLAKNFKYAHSARPREKDLQYVDEWWKSRLESMKNVEKRYLQ